MTPEERSRKARLNAIDSAGYCDLYHRDPEGLVAVSLGLPCLAPCRVSAIIVNRLAENMSGKKRELIYHKKASIAWGYIGKHIRLCNRPLLLFLQTKRTE